LDDDMKYIAIAGGMFCGAMVYAQAATTQAAAGERPPMNVLLLRFDQLDQQAGMQWVGRAVQQSLLAEAVRLRTVQAITPKEETLTNHSTTDQSVAQRMGQEAGAEYVIFGSYQTLENELRLTGSILDVSSGKIIGGLKATGAVRDLFGLQDQMAEQMKKQLINLYAPPATQPAMANVPPPSTPPNVLSTPVPNSTPFQGSSLQRSLRYKGSIYETYKSEQHQRAANNYYYSYPNAYYGGWSGGYTFTPWWGGYYGSYRGHLPAMIQRGLTATGKSGD
jgi:TolB-like protein